MKSSSGPWKWDPLLCCHKERPPGIPCSRSYQSPSVLRLSWTQLQKGCWQSRFSEGIAAQPKASGFLCGIIESSWKCPLGLGFIYIHFFPPKADEELASLGAQVSPHRHQPLGLSCGKSLEATLLGKVGWDCKSKRRGGDRELHFRVLQLF